MNAFQDDVEMVDADKESPLFSDEEEDDDDEAEVDDERHAAPGDSSSKISSLSVGYKDRSFFVRGVCVFIMYIFYINIIMSSRLLVY